MVQVEPGLNPKRLVSSALETVLETKIYPILYDKLRMINFAIDVNCLRPYNTLDLGGRGEDQSAPIGHLRARALRYCQGKGTFQANLSRVVEFCQ